MEDFDNFNASSLSASSEASDCNLGHPAISDKFRQRMQPCQQPVFERSPCPCCGRNFRDARDALANFQEFIAAETAAVEALKFSDNERRVLLSSSFLCRLLARCGCNFKQALERLTVAIALHRKYSLDQIHLCSVCWSKPGYHSFRQVGFDRLGRPVLYTCLNQDLETGTQPEQVKDYFLHMISTVMEAEKTIPENQHSLIMIFDTNGLSMSHVRTDTVSQFGELLRYFPARLCYALLLNLSGVSRFLLKPIIHLTGHQDDILALKPYDAEQQLAECFDPPLVQWILHEMEQNKRPKIPFYVAPTQTPQPDSHDPRGELSYVANYIAKRHPSGHQPHPSIVSALVFSR